MRFYSFALSISIALHIESLSTTNACSYLKGKTSTTHDKEQVQRALQSPYTYGRFFDEETVPTYSTSVHDLIASSSPGGSYMDESGRTSRGLLLLKGTDSDGNQRQFDDFRIRGLAEAGLAGYTYLAQLISHDMNLDLTSVLGVPTDPTDLPNANTPFLDLDTIYDFNGNKGTFDKDGKFLIGISASGVKVDFPRDADGNALIADARNDELKILAHICVVFMMLHNKFFDEYIAVSNGNSKAVKAAAFEFAKAETQRNWQSIIEHDLLPQLCDNDVLNNIKNDSYTFHLYTGEIELASDMPVEFSTAAWRLIHSRPASGYRLQAAGPRLGLFPSGTGGEASLAGGSQLLAGEMTDFNCFFGSTDGSCGAGTASARNPQSGHILDMLYGSTLLKMSVGGPGVPAGVVTISDGGTTISLVGDLYQLDDDTPTADLATLDVVRAQTHKVPGGLALAEHVASIGGNVHVLSLGKMESSPFGLPNDFTNTKKDVPLLWYLAHEALDESQGRRLGKLGSTIVGETVFKLIWRTDSYDETWESSVTGRKEVAFLDLVNYVGWDWTIDAHTDTLFN